MKGKISLKDFIQSVKEELLSSLDNETPFFTIDGVQLEVSFGVQAEAEAGFKFFVFDAKAKVGASQSHKVTLNLTPFLKNNSGSRTRPTASQGISALQRTRVPTASGAGGRMSAQKLGAVAAVKGKPGKVSKKPKPGKGKLSDLLGR